MTSQIEYLNSFNSDQRETKSDNRYSSFDEEENNEEKEKIQSLNVASGEKSSTAQKLEKNRNFLLLEGNEIICIINILASAFGGGCFTFPYIIYSLGLINSLLVFIFVSACIYFSIDLIRNFVVDSKFFSFGQITHSTLGYFWLRIYCICSFILNMSVLVYYLNLVYSFMIRIIKLWPGKISEIIYFLITTFIEISLCLFTSYLPKLYILSSISVILFLIIVIIIIAIGITQWTFKDVSEKFSEFNLLYIKAENDSSWNTFLMIMSKFIEYVFGYAYHCTFPTLLGCLENPTKEKTKKIHIISFLIIFSFYAFVSFFGYLFQKDVPKNLFINEEILSNNTFLNNTIKGILILLLIILVPVRYIVIRDNYTSLSIHNLIPMKFDYIITSICLLICNVIVFFTKDKNQSGEILSKLVGIFGGLFGVFICFVLPMLNHVAINGGKKKRAIISYIISFIFLAIGIFTFVYNINNI